MRITALEGTVYKQSLEIDKLKYEIDILKRTIDANNETTEAFKKRIKNLENIASCYKSTRHLYK